jgi:hypothetical protein
MEMKRIAVYLVGLLTGAGIAVGVVSHATDSTIPYSFKDGQVISADTMNDLFARLQNVVVGFSSENELYGAWTCTTYDADSTALTSINSAPSGAGAKNFTFDNATGLYSMTQTWTFGSNGSNGTILNTTNNTKFGGANANITGACPSATSINYSAKVIQSTLLVSGLAGGCAAGNGQALQLQKNSPYQFHTVSGQTFISCVAVNQPPNIPTGLAAAVSGSGVNLSWTDASNGSATGFTILKKVSGAYTSIGTVSSGTTSFTDSSGAAGALYRVQANNSSNGLNSIPSMAAMAQ